MQLQVVDAFGELLAEELQSTGKTKSAIFSSVAWVRTVSTMFQLCITCVSHVYQQFADIHFFRQLSVFENKIEGMNGFLMTPLFRLYGISDMLFFPMINTAEFHYTLLVFYKEAKKWVHYNPYRGRRENARDKCFENSKKIVSI